MSHLVSQKEEILKFVFLEMDLDDNNNLYFKLI